MEEKYFQVIEKIKKMKHLDSVAAVAKELGMSRNNLYNYEKRKSLPMKALHSFCVREGISLDSLLSIEAETDLTTVNLSTGNDLGLLIAQAGIVLNSNTVYAEALKQNIKAFFHGVKTETEPNKPDKQTSGTSPGATQGAAKASG